jgi:MFS family permease
VTDDLPPPPPDAIPRARAAPAGPAAGILRTYLALTLLATFASSFVWGINTLFLLDAGLSLTEAFAANAFFTAGQVVFEVPTGAAADAMGRRASYLLGAATLFAATLLYLLMWRIHGPFWGWAASSVLLGLGFTFFSGSTEAWLVDGLTATGYRDGLDVAFSRGQVAQGVGMLSGAVAGGVLAQATSLGVPYLLRAGVLAITFAVAFARMHDVGFTPARAPPGRIVRDVLEASWRYGLRARPVRWVMLADLVAGGVPIFAFYALQPYLLELAGRPGSYALAGLGAAIVAGAQIAGGWLAPLARRAFRRRTSALLAAAVASTAALAGLWLARGLYAVLGLVVLWAVVWAATQPLRQTYLNGLVPSEHRATVLSFDNLLMSAGGVVAQPALGRAAQLWGYPASYLASAAVQLAAVPFLWLARRERAGSDPFAEGGGE